jgi:outer membrane lipopolysaccharide assembly protein LptE/RlpB
MKNDLIIFSVLLIIVALMGGCGSFQLKSYTKSTIPLNIETANIEKTVYFVFKNNSPHPSQLDSLIRTKLEENGYKIVSDAQSASFSLKVTPVKISNDNGTQFDLANVLEIGENTQYNVTKDLMLNNQLNSGLETSSLMGAAAGLVVMTFVGSLAYMTADGNIRMQVDVNITQPENKASYTRVLSEAERMRLDINEAQPILEGNISNKIVSFFKQ